MLLLFNVVVVVFVVVVDVVVVVVVVATWEEWKFPILSYSKGRSACQRSYADPPFEAPLSESVFTHPSSLPTLPSS